jgi:hypothetical protein
MIAIGVFLMVASMVLSMLVGGYSDHYYEKTRMGFHIIFTVGILLLTAGLCMYLWAYLP